MKKITIFLSFFLIFILLYQIPAFGLNIEAESSILIDAATGRIIYEDDSHKNLYPASTTKILTALLALENMNSLSQDITIPSDFINVGESGINLQAGETYLMEDLLYALMLRSANDAAQVIAIAIFGSEESFVEKMNDRTVELGLKDSFWKNPHGLDQDGQFSCAYDLAMITREALSISFFNELITADSWNLPWAANDSDRILYNHNQFLYSYEGADGVKTGYTNLAGNCLVASATRNGMRLIGVVMNCPDQTHYEQMNLLMNYGFENFEPCILANSGDILGKVNILRSNFDEADAVLKDDIVAAIPKGSTINFTSTIDLPKLIKAPISLDQQIGSITFRDKNGNTVIAPIYLKDEAKLFTFFIVFKQVLQRTIDAFF